jgi:hypothetical protein
MNAIGSLISRLFASSNNLPACFVRAFIEVPACVRYSGMVTARSED